MTKPGTTSDNGYVRLPQYPRPLLPPPLPITHLPEGKDNVYFSSICLPASRAGSVIMDTQEKLLKERVKMYEFKDDTRQATTQCLLMINYIFARTVCVYVRERERNETLSPVFLRVEMSPQKRKKGKWIVKLNSHEDRGKTIKHM